MWSVVVLLIAIFATIREIVVYLQKRRRRAEFAKLHGCKPAAASCLRYPWLLGLDLMIEQTINVFQHRFAERVRQSFQRYGLTYTGRILRKPFIATLDPVNLETMMKSRSSDYNIIPGRRKLIRILYGEGVFSTDGHAWKESRILVKAGLSNFSYDPDRFEPHAEALLTRLRSCNSEKVDFTEPVAAYTIDVATDILFGRSSYTQRDNHPDASDLAFAQNFMFLGGMARVLTIMITQIPYLAEIMYRREYFRAQARTFDYVDSRIQEALQVHQSKKVEQHLGNAPVRPVSVIDGLLRQSQDVRRVRSELLNLLLAGNDTVGIALSEMFYCLARNPIAWNKLRAEVASNLGSAIPTQADLKRMPYLSWTINEAIRIRPTLSVHARRANCDTVLPRGGGTNGDEPLLVEKDEYVVYSNYALYRNPAVFGEDVDEFRPERWETIRPKTFEYLSFGAGPRFCPGKEMGWTMLAYMTVRLAQEVEEILPMDDRPWQEAKAFSFHNRHGVHLAFKWAR